MSTLRLPGLITGIDTDKLIAQLMAIESRTLNMYQARKKVWDERKDALSTLETKLTTLRTSVHAVSDAEKLRAFKVASSDTDILTAEASYNAFEGNHTVVINQLATAERSVHTAGLEYLEDLVGAGTFIYSYNHKETAITTTAETTLEDLVGLINNDANNPGVTASLLYYDNAYHLVLNGDDAGSDYKILVNSSSTEVWDSDNTYEVNGQNATLTSKISQLDGLTWASGDKITINGTDRNGVAVNTVELTVTQDTRIEHLISEINDAFDGIAKARFEDGKIFLTDNTCGTSDLSISLSYTGGKLNLDMAVATAGGGTPATLADFAADDFTETQSAQDSKIKVDGFPTSLPVPEVQQLAVSSAPTAGKFTLSFDGQTTAEIDYNADLTTIQAALNDLDSITAVGGVTVGGTALDLGGPLTFTFAATAGDVNTIAFNPATGLTPASRLNYIMSEQTKGSDGYIRRSSNTVTDIIYGITLHLHDTTDSNGQQITLTRDIQSVKDKLNTMIAAYNTAVNYIQEKTGYNDVLKTAGVLMGDYIVSLIKTNLTNPLITQTKGFIEDVDTFLTPAHIGLELDKDGLLNLDVNAFNDAIAEDYLGTLAIIGANKTGSSTSNTIEFYGASSNYTTADEYDVSVTIAGGAITVAKIKLTTESSWRYATVNQNIITGNSTFNENGNPVYPENGLQLSVDLSQNGPFTAKIRVKQGFAGAIEDVLDKILKTTTGSIDIDQEHIGDTVKYLQDKIETEEDRLADREERLVARFALLERTLTSIQTQLAAFGFSG